MTVVLARLSAPPSPLSRLDPRWKLLALVPAAAAVLFLRGLFACLVAFVAALALAALGRLPWRPLLARLGAAALLVALLAAFLPFMAAGHGPGWDLGPVRVWQYGLMAAARLLLKAVTVLALLLVLGATSRPAELFRAAHALRFPGLFLQLLQLSYRYLYLLLDELRRLRVALRVRGYRNRMRLHSYRTAGHVVGTLLVRSSERAERVGHAMRCRGFDGCFRALYEPRTGPADVFFFALVVGGSAGLLAWDLWQR
jgi:cobalt/nickel transport system permease protein